MAANLAANLTSSIALLSVQASCILLWTLAWPPVCQLSTTLEYAHLSAVSTEMVQMLGI